MWKNIMVIGTGGFLGAVARYGLSGLIQRHLKSLFPVGVLLVNLLGCFVMGALIALIDGALFQPRFRLFCITGFLGSFTTLSAVGYQTFELFKTDHLGLALGNMILNMGMGVVAVGLGWMMVKGQM